MLYGVKGVPLLSRLSSLDLAQSCPYDFMHLIWENLIKNLILLWNDDFKGLDEGSGSYVINGSVWDAIGAGTSKSGKTIPGCYGAHPPDFRAEKQSMTTDTWSFQALYLGPVLLYHKFRDAKYYWHFVRLVELLHLCLQFELKREEVAKIREGFIDWVKDYEEYVCLICVSLRAELTLTVGFTTSTIQRASPCALSRFTPFSTLPTASSFADPYGRTGHFLWKDTVASFAHTSAAGNTHMCRLIVPF